MPDPNAAELGKKKKTWLELPIEMVRKQKNVTCVRCLLYKANEVAVPGRSTKKEEL